MVIYRWLIGERHYRPRTGQADNNQRGKYLCILVRTDNHRSGTVVLRSGMSDTDIGASNNILVDLWAVKRRLSFNIVWSDNVGRQSGEALIAGDNDGGSAEYES
jgi:hypothetical protein